MCITYFLFELSVFKILGHTPGICVNLTLLLYTKSFNQHLLNYFFKFRYDLFKFD